MDLNVLLFKKQKIKKTASPKQNFSNADAEGDAVPREQCRYFQMAARIIS